MRKKRHNYTAQEKVVILKRHLVDQVPVSDLCDEYQLQPTVFYRWQKDFFENGAAAFEKANSRQKKAEEKRIQQLEASCPGDKHGGFWQWSPQSASPSKKLLSLQNTESLEDMLRWVNFGRRLSPKEGHFCMPTNNPGALRSHTQDSLGRSRRLTDARQGSGSRTRSSLRAGRPGHRL